jgi:hypothetical protein
VSTAHTEVKKSELKTKLSRKATTEKRILKAIA